MILKVSKIRFPEFRDYTVELCGVKEAVPKVYISGKKIKITYEYQWKKGCIRIHIPKVSVDEKVEIVFEQKLTLNDNHTLERVYDLLNQAQDSNLAKESAYRLCFFRYPQYCIYNTRMGLNTISFEAHRYTCRYTCGFYSLSADLLFRYFRYLDL